MTLSRFKHYTLKMNSCNVVVLLLVAAASFVGVSALNAPPDSDLCNAATPMADFDPTLMDGLWYNVEITATSTFASDICGKETVNATADGNMTIVQTTYDQEENFSSDDTKSGFPLDGNIKARMIFDAGTFKGLMYIYLGTDYKKYVVRYVCSGFIANYIQVLSKDKSIDDSTLATVKDIMKKNNLDTVLTPVNQNVPPCP